MRPEIIAIHFGLGQAARPDAVAEILILRVV